MLLDRVREDIIAITLPPPPRYHYQIATRVGFYQRHLHFIVRSKDGQRGVAGVVSAELSVTRKFRHTTDIQHRCLAVASPTLPNEPACASKNSLLI